MISIYKPSEESLDTLISETRERNPNWQRDFLAGLARELREDPRRYKSFGPYWWLIKKELLAAGYTEFGHFMDQEWLDNMDYGNTAYNLAAAWGYSDWATDNGYLYATRHPYALRDSDTEEQFGEEVWENAVYVLEDTDMEAIMK